MLKIQRQLVLGIELWGCIDVSTGEEIAVYASEEKAQQFCDKENQRRKLYADSITRPKS